MQTFLPYPDFEMTARALDYRRLGKQRVEAYQILLVLTDSYEKKGWRNHPAVKMWRGYEIALWNYAIAICDEWISRGYKDTCRVKIFDLLVPAWQSKNEWPAWLGDSKFHKSHQSNLIRKDHDFYAPKFPGVPDNLPYVWPV